MRFLLFAAFSATTSLAAIQNACAEAWRAGAASAIITPAEWMPMAGYASRDRPADGKVTELYSKAMVLESANHTRAVIVTLDLVGIDRELSSEVRQLVAKKYSIPESQILRGSKLTFRNRRLWQDTRMTLWHTSLAIEY